MMNRLKRFIADKRGVSAVEFALIAPLMILIYLGTAEAALMLMMDRKVTNAASTLGDLVARTPCIANQAEIEGVFDAARSVMAPYNTEDNALKLRVYSIKLENLADEEYELQWEELSDESMPDFTGEPSLPDNLLTVEGTGVVVAEASYEYDPPFGQILEDSIVLKSKIYFSPRRSITVENPCPTL